MFAAKDFFELQGKEHASIFSNSEPVWTALGRLKDYLATFFVDDWPLRGISGPIHTPLVILEGEILEGLDVRTTGPKNRVQVFKQGNLLEGASVLLPGAYLFDDRIILGPGSVVEPGALIKGPAVIGDRAEIRQGAYMRGDCLVGHDTVVGHTTEIKASIMLDGAKAGHFAYIGDSILGQNVNLGAGTKLANLKMIPGSVVIKTEGQHHDTGRRKIGAILGDGTETGCNSVMSPGTLMGPNSIVYPAVAVPAGLYPPRTIVAPQADALNIRRPRKRQ